MDSCHGLPGGAGYLRTSIIAYLDCTLYFGLPSSIKPYDFTDRSTWIAFRYLLPHEIKAQLRPLQRLCYSSG